MRLAIIVPVYEEHSTLPGQLAHLRELCGVEPELEVLLVDGGSTDGTRELLSESGLPWITADRGRALQMNAGAAAASGDLLLFLHADTRLPPGALDAIRAAATSSIGGFFRVRLESPRLLLRLTGHLISLRSRLTGIATGDQAIWLRREEFEALGGFPETPLFEDVEMCRLAGQSGRLAPLAPEVTTSARRWERAGPWRTILRMWLLRSAYWCGVEPDRLARYYRVAR